MRSLLTRAAVTALGTILAVSLLVAAKSGPGGPPSALSAAGAIGRPRARSAAVAAAPPQPEPTIGATIPPPASSSSSTTQPVAPAVLPSTTTRPAPPSSTTTARPVTSSTTVTTRPLPRPAPTTATTARPTTTSAAPPVTAPPTTTTTTTTAPPATTTMDSPVFTASLGFETFGTVQVRLTLQGHRIVDAVALQTPNERARSVQINARAVPILRQEVLDAQSAQIDTVSGATATSKAYAQCIQAILDQAWK